MYRDSEREVLALIGVGANMEHRHAHCRTAVIHLGETPGVRVRAVSRWRETAPVGPVHQGPFINGAVAVSTPMDPHDLLALLLDIETRMGRVRGVRWGPRVIDLDLLVHGETCRAGAGLTVPHPEILQRPFVLEPLAEIAPQVRHPGTGQTFSQLWARWRADTAPVNGMAVGAADVRG